MFCIQNEENGIEPDPPLTLEEIIIKLDDLKKINNELSEILLTSIETSTELYNAMDDYELKYAKTLEKV